MSDLYRKNPITADGFYDMEVDSGNFYLFTLKGNFGGATVVMTIRSDVDNSVFDDVIGGSWTAETEKTLIPSGSVIRLTVSGGTSSSIRASFNLIRHAQ
jgi:hypothetical protein